MISFLLRLRVLAGAIVVLLLVHSLALLVVGAIRAFDAYRIIVSGVAWTGAQRPGIHIVESVDALLLSLVFFVLAVGVGSLFVSARDPGHVERLPEWMRFRNLSELKYTLWEAVLVAMVVASITSFIEHMDHLGWDDLIIPGAVLLLSASLAILRRAGSH